MTLVTRFNDIFVSRLQRTLPRNNVSRPNRILTLVLHLSNQSSCLLSRVSRFSPRRQVSDWTTWDGDLEAWSQPRQGLASVSEKLTWKLATSDYRVQPADLDCPSMEGNCYGVSGYQISSYMPKNSDQREQTLIQKLIAWNLDPWISEITFVMDIIYIVVF